MLVRLITGIVLIALGVAIGIASFYSTFVFLIYTVIFIALGIAILLNKKEDKIETRKDLK